MSLERFLKRILVGSALLGAAFLSSTAFSKDMNHPTFAEVRTEAHSVRQQFGKGAYITSFDFDSPFKLKLDLSDKDGIDKVVFGMSKHDRKTLRCKNKTKFPLTLRARRDSRVEYDVSVKDSRGIWSSLSVYMEPWQNSSLRIKTKDRSYQVLRQKDVFYIDTFEAGSPLNFELEFRDGDGIDKIMFAYSEKVVQCNGVKQKSMKFYANRHCNHEVSLRFYDTKGNHSSVEMFVRQYRSRFKKFKKRGSDYRHNMKRGRRTYSR